MSSTVRAAKCDAHRTRRAARVLFSACIVATLPLAAITPADQPQTEIVGWGDQIFGVDLSSGFVALAANFPAYAAPHLIRVRLIIVRRLATIKANHEHAPSPRYVHGH